MTSNLSPKDPQINLHDYGLIIFDIDGTLIGSDHRLNPYTCSVLLRLREHGLDFSLATGKNLPAVGMLADTLEINLPLVLSNGSMIETRQGKILEKSVLPEGVVREVIKVCESHNSDLVFYINNDIIVKQITPDISYIYDQVIDSVVEAGDWKNIEDRFADVNKSLVINLQNAQSLKNLEREFNDAFSRKADILFSSAKMLEVMPQGITKVTGIRHLAASLSIEMHAVMAFGDYDNDVEMLAAAGLGIAVANGSEAAKASADLVIDSCDQNGPAKFLEELMAVS